MSAVGAVKKLIIVNDAGAAAAFSFFIDSLIIPPALVRIEGGIAIIAHRKGHTCFNSEEGDKKEAQVLIDPFDMDVGMSADRAGSGLSF